MKRLVLFYISFNAQFCVAPRMLKIQKAPQ